MDSLRNRIPTRQQALQLWLICTVPLHTWSIVMFFYKVPVYLNRADIGHILGVFSYTQAFALFESLVVWGFLLFVCLALPGRFFNERFVAQGALYYLLTFVWVIPAHYQMNILAMLSENMVTYQLLAALWVISFFAAMIGASIFLRRSPPFERAWLSFLDRFTPLAWLFVTTGVISIGVVILRNWV